MPTVYLIIRIQCPSSQTTKPPIIAHPLGPFPKPDPFPTRTERAVTVAPPNNTGIAYTLKVNAPTTTTASKVRIEDVSWNLSDAEELLAGYIKDEALESVRNYGFTDSQWLKTNASIEVEMVVGSAGSDKVWWCLLKVDCQSFC